MFWIFVVCILLCAILPMVTPVEARVRNLLFIVAAVAAILLILSLVMGWSGSPFVHHTVP